VNDAPSTMYVLVSGEMNPFVSASAPADGSPITIMVNPKTPEGLLGAGTVTIHSTS
jgi:hypothetical protein